MSVRRLAALLAVLALLALGTVLLRPSAPPDAAPPPTESQAAADPAPAIAPPDAEAPEPAPTEEITDLLPPSDEAELLPDPVIVAPAPSDPGFLDRLNDFAQGLTLPALPAPEAGAAPPEFSAIDPNPDGPYAIVTLCYATNRALGPYFADAPGQAFTAERGPPVWGLARVSIPRDHRMGELESPGWLLSLVSMPDPRDHVTLIDAEPLTRDEVLAWMDRQLATQDALLLYVHGYNHDFDKAARRAAQLTYDLGWQGPSFFVSWPSRGQTSAYTVDRQTAEFSRPFLRDVLRDLAARPADRIVVIAHSMGSWLLAEALADLAREDPAAAARFRTLILAAPDIDADVFATQLAPAFRTLGEMNVTVYASSEDAALEASARVNGFRRIGDTSGGVTLVEGVDMIDATGAVSDFFGHTYYGDNTSILGDIFDLVHRGLPPSERPRLDEVRRDDGIHWRIRLTE